MDIRQILLLKIKGYSNRKISGEIDVHRNTVNEYVRLFDAAPKSYEELLGQNDKELESMFTRKSNINCSRYDELSSQFNYFRDELKKPGCTRQVLWQLYIEKHPNGYQRSQFNEYLYRWLKETKSSGKLHHKAGDKLYVDYTGKKLHYVDRETGEQIEVEVFVGILPCSQLTYVEASQSQKQVDFISSVSNCLEYMEGVPQAIVPDNLKSAVTKASKYEPTLNKMFKDFAMHYGCSINPTRSYSPQDKALVESAVKLVYQRIFYPINEMTFFSLEQLNTELRRRLESYNDYLLTTTQVSRRHQFQTIERPFLSALPRSPYEIKTFKQATVQKMGYVFISENRNYYSVPYRYIQKKVELRYNQKMVEVYYKQERIALHPRSIKRGQYVTIADHLSSTHKFYQNWSPAFFEKLAIPHGLHVQAYVKELIEQAQYPEIAYKQCLGILRLGKDCGSDRLDKACLRAGGLHRKGYHILKTILENRVEDQPNEVKTEQVHIPPHNNVRGSKYFKNIVSLLF